VGVRDGATKEQFTELGGLAASEEIVTMVQFAAALAQLRATYAPTLLILDGGGWNWSQSLFDYFAPFLAMQPYQIVLTYPARRMDLNKRKWANRQAVEIKLDTERERSRIISRDDQTNCQMAFVFAGAYCNVLRT
jgi:hypothetical protein